MGYNPHQIGEDPITKAVKDLTKKLDQTNQLLGKLISVTVTTTTTVAP